MAYSKHRAIRVAVAALLTAGTPVAGGNVFQNRDYALPAGLRSQVHVNYVDSVPSEVEITGAPIDWLTTIELVIKARGAAGGESAVDAADAIWTEAYSRICADPTLGGTVGLLTQGPMTTEDDEAEVGVCQITWRFVYQHRTTNNAIS